ncbi:MAG: extracellular solute-binding protein [Lachnospiraceae bacterium]|nr:extracellular solute-binding protein [Lachnospiraceae bacterium]
MRRFISILLSCILAVSITGCQLVPTSSSPAQPTVLRLLLREGTYTDVVKHSLETFEQEHNVICDVVALSESKLHDSIAISNTSGESFDLCQVSGSWMAEFTEKGLLENLSAHGYVFDSDIIPRTTEISYYQGKIYLIPYLGNVSVLFYNKALLEDSGHTPEDLTTLETIYETCKTASDNGHIGFMYRGDTNVIVDFMPFLISYGGWWIDDQHQPTVTTPEFKAALGYYKKLTDTGKCSTKEDIINAISRGHGAMSIGWPAWYLPTDSSPASYCELNGKVADGHECHNANIYGIWALGISANSPHKDLSYELLTYLMDPTVQKNSMEVGGVPCRYSCLRDSNVLSRYPQYDSICAALENGTYRPFMANWSDFEKVLTPHIIDVLQNRSDIDTAMEAAQNELKELMGQNQ